MTLLEKKFDSKKHQVPPASSLRFKNFSNPSGPPLGVISSPFGLKRRCRIVRYLQPAMIQNKKKEFRSLKIRRPTHFYPPIHLLFTLFSTCLVAASKFFLRGSRGTFAYDCLHFVRSCVDRVGSFTRNFDIEARRREKGT